MRNKIRFKLWCQLDRVSEGFDLSFIPSSQCSQQSQHTLSRPGLLPQLILGVGGLVIREVVDVPPRPRVFPRHLRGGCHAGGRGRLEAGHLSVLKAVLPDGAG